VREDLAKLEVPEIWVELGEKKIKKRLIGVVYREHRKWGEKAQSNKVGEERLRNWLNRQEKQLGDKKDKIILGDWNTDWRREQESKKKQEKNY
jgi:hypothetical protein